MSINSIYTNPVKKTCNRKPLHSPELFPIFVPQDKENMYIDTHSHIYAEEFDNDRDETVRRAFEADVRYIILPDIDQSTRQSMLALAGQYPDNLFPLLGVHPTSVNASYKEEMKAFEKLLGQTTIYGIGECGIDLYWDKTYYKEQIVVFERQLHIAREMDLPVVIHSRESLPEIFAVLKKQHYNMKGILHCFPGNEEDARRAIDLGFRLGIGGVVTFKKSSMAEVVGKIETEHLVLETDAPYLAPVPFRGKRNESSYIPYIATKIAEIRGIDTKKLQEITTNNAMNLFNLHSKSVESKF